MPPGGDQHVLRASVIGAQDLTTGPIGSAAPRPHESTAGPARRSGERPSIAVALHDIEPATFERCALIRDWLFDHGIDRVTLLVIPARDLHPLARRSPELVDWLLDCRRGGDAIAQHGFQHLQVRRPGGPRERLVSAPAGRTAEFVGLDLGETRRAVEAGRRTLKLAGLEPVGFVAPAYAYTPALHETLAARYRWWAGLLRLHRAAAPAAREVLAPAWSLNSKGPLRRLLSPLAVRAGAVTAGQTLRLDLHPCDMQWPRHMLALEAVLRRASPRREAVTYDDLAAG